MDTAPRRKNGRKRRRWTEVFAMRGHVSYVAQIRAEQTGGGGQGAATTILTPKPKIKHRR
jgi:hypothetical protein